ncbi:hypothetical protein [Halorussus salinus]|uniref:hypothetical protein n=1 Tax=Halorussus salinus TaxID=1364935 RepID=UPI001091A943|nr:hypothetical protein [Halorussus salinus]
MSHHATDKTDEVPSGKSPDESRDADETLSWDEAASGFERQLEQRRTVGVEVPEMGVAEFTLRGLSREERDEVEQQAASVERNGRRDAQVEVDTGAIRRTMLKYGIVSGPEGFKPQREDHLDALPPGVQDELVDLVEDMSTLSVEERDGFQAMG